MTANLLGERTPIDVRAIERELTALWKQAADSQDEGEDEHQHRERQDGVDGDLAALEVNMRQPGGLTVDMWNWANDIGSLVELVADHLVEDAKPPAA